jgi:RNA polymerase sigma-70 factor (ECF subfamily)
MNIPLDKRRDSAARAASSAEPFDEQCLMAGLRNGEDQAYKHLVREEGGRMLTVAHRMLGSEADASDAVQDAFVSAFKAINSFEGSSSLGTWLHRILINACLMKLRTRDNHYTISIDDLLPHFDESGHHASAVRRWTATPQELLEQTETCARVRALIDQLPDDYRTVMLLRDIEEIDTEQAAQTLGISPGAVKVRLHRARQALRTLLQEIDASGI